MLEEQTCSAAWAQIRQRGSSQWVTHGVHHWDRAAGAVWGCLVGQ